MDICVINEAYFTGFMSNLTGKFLTKARDAGHVIHDHLHRNKTVKQLLADQVPHIMSKLFEKLQASPQDKLKLKAVVDGVINHHMQGEDSAA